MYVKCKLNCKNPHNDGGTCPKCINSSPLVLDQTSSIDSVVESTHDIEESDSEDEGDVDSGMDDVELPLIVLVFELFSDVESDSDTNIDV